MNNGAIHFVMRDQSAFPTNRPSSNASSKFDVYSDNDRDYESSNDDYSMPISIRRHGGDSVSSSSVSSSDTLDQYRSSGSSLSFHQDFNRLILEDLDSNNDNNNNNNKENESSPIKSEHLLLGKQNVDPPKVQQRVRLNQVDDASLQKYDSDYTSSEHDESPKHLGNGSGYTREEEEQEQEQEQEQDESVSTVISATVDRELEEGKDAKEQTPIAKIHAQIDRIVRMTSGQKFVDNRTLKSALQITGLCSDLKTTLAEFYESQQQQQPVEDVPKKREESLLRQIEVLQAQNELLIKDNEDLKLKATITTTTTTTPPLSTSSELAMDVAQRIQQIKSLESDLESKRKECELLIISNKDLGNSVSKLTKQLNDSLDKIRFLEDEVNNNSNDKNNNDDDTRILRDEYKKRMTKEAMERIEYLKLDEMPYNDSIKLLKGIVFFSQEKVSNQLQYTHWTRRSLRLFEDFYQSLHTSMYPNTLVSRDLLLCGNIDCDADTQRSNLVSLKQCLDGILEIIAEEK